MIDFIVSFIGQGITAYPFLVAVLSVILASVIFFMFYTIVASIFRMR